MQVDIKGITQLLVSLVGPSDQAYASASSPFLSKVSSPISSYLMPFSIVIINSAQVGIVGYTFRWIFTHPDGSQTTPQSTFIQIHQLFNNEGGPQFKDPGRGSSIPPGGSRLISPLMTLDGVSVAAPSLSGLSDFYMKMRDCTQLTVILDAILFQDGLFAGPDVSGSFDKFRAAVDGEQDLLSEVVASLESGVPAETIVSNTLTPAAQGRTTHGPLATYAEWYTFFRGNTATQLLAAWQVKGAGGIGERALALLYKQRPLLYQ